MEHERLIERTCCVCRSKADKRSMARLVCERGALSWDYSQRAPGRGAYVHLATECLSRMGAASRWEHVLKLAPGSLVGAQVSEVTRSLMQEVHGRLPQHSGQTLRGPVGLFRGQTRR
jgi:predicted RNA-binding protein YlxR (DUF448 family)